MQTQRDLDLELFMIHVTEHIFYFDTVRNLFTFEDEIEVVICPFPSPTVVMIDFSTKLQKSVSRKCLEGEHLTISTYLARYVG